VSGKRRAEREEQVGIGVLMEFMQPAETFSIARVMPPTFPTSAKDWVLTGKYS